MKIGDAVPRFEDQRLLTGGGNYTDDSVDASCAWMVLVRSPFAAAAVTSIDIEDARSAPGVLDVFTRADLDADGIGVFSSPFPFKRPDGQNMISPPFGMLAGESVNYVGDPVVAVVAETLAQAEEAAELVTIDFEDRPAVTDAKKAMASEAPQLWAHTPGNVAFVAERGDKASTDQAFSRATHVTALHLRITRVTAASLEPRSAIGSFDTEKGTYTLRAGSQTPHRLRDTLANSILNIDPSQLRVISPDIGGAFGMKNNVYAEYALVLWAAKRLHRTVSWRSTRNEAMQSDFQGRDNHVHGELALDGDGRILAVRVKTVANLGAYLSMTTPHPPTANIGGLVGPYTIDAAYAEITGVHTHTPPTAPYRGAGRPEATYIIERLVDAAAHDLGIDPVDLRRRNLLAPAALPRQTPFGQTYDCGDFPAVLDKAVATSDWDGFDKRKSQSASRGLLRGRGIAYSIEIAGGPQGAHMPESVSIKFDDTGHLTLAVGSKEMGTGHGTAYRQILCDRLGMEAHQIAVVDGDTDEVERGTGSFGSRTMIAGGTAAMRAADQLIERGTTLAAEALEAAEVDVEFSNGGFQIVGTDKRISLTELSSKSPDFLAIRVTEKADGPTFPNGCHICEVEIDPDTGVTRLDRYTVIDDVGTVINPLIMKGQMHGGIAQGAGQALMEEIVFDEDTGQLISGSLLDYTLPRADDLPLFSVDSHPVPTQLNPTGAKGAGEAGTVGALPVLVLATLDALRPLGVMHIDMPLTPERVWQAIRSAAH